MKVMVPGKLILSGEHAVVHGQPALAMAVNRYATATITENRLPRVSFDLSDLAHRSHLHIHGLRDLKNRIKRKYHRFMRGEYTIRDVLLKPFELAQFAMSLFAESMNIALPHGVNIHLQSDIPMGCGMGSSSATVLSVMKAVSTYLNIPLSSEALYQLALEAENMQHGHASGLDLRVAMQGGGVYLHQGELTPRHFAEFPWFLINTGTPLTTTGECVTHVAPCFKDAVLANAFGDVTQSMDAALSSASLTDLKQALVANHHLLDRIGVVPTKVKQFITDIEALSGAAKVCGAGAVAGDAAGVVLVIMQDELALKALCLKYGYTMLPLMTDQRGVHVV
ncbi:MAG TPA: mevalonate kinase [Gammaproteobacteria bacterium]|jgi:mevalonate kinase|nr:mevalonate kinase [Gammaproteobacteria bacterium]